MKKFDFKKIGLKVVGVSAGAVGAELLNKPLENMNPKLRGALKIVAGAVIPEVAPKMAILGNVGDGIIANGAIDLYKGFTEGGSGDSTSGIGAGQFDDDQFVVDPDYVVSGIDDYEPLSGVDDEEGPISGEMFDEED